MPARASAFSVKVYPRVCGGTLPANVHARMMQGLSPRVRGNRRNPICGRPGARSIPACAGEPPDR